MENKLQKKRDNDLVPKESKEPAIIPQSDKVWLFLFKQ